VSKNNNRSEQQQVDVFEEVSAEATKDNIVTKEEKAQEKEKEKKEERDRLDKIMRLANDPVDW
jgi:hypothetical protein